MDIIFLNTLYNVLARFDGGVPFRLLTEAMTLEKGDDRGFHPYVPGQRRIVQGAFCRLKAIFVLRRI